MIGGKKFVVLRAARILFPVFVFAAIIIVNDPTTFNFELWQLFGYIPLAFSIWMGFLHYRFFPWDEHDLDWEQRYFLLSGRRNGSIPPYKITPSEKMELDLLEMHIEAYYSNSLWARTRSLIPLALGIAGIVGWAIYWS